MPEKVEAERRRAVSGRPSSGRKAYGGPIIAGGKVFVGTNNEQPRNKRDIKKNADGEVEPIDKGILMCFDEKTGKFLWQAVHDKLPDGSVTRLAAGRASARRRPSRATASTTSATAARVVCADVNGMADGNQGIQTEKYKDADRRRHHLGIRHDQGTERLPAQHGGLLARSIVGDIIFVVTANGVDEGHINIPAPEAPSFIALDKKTGKLLWKSNLPGKNIMHGQWSNPAYARDRRRQAGHLPRRRRLALRLRARDGRADLEVRLQPEGRGVRARRHRHPQRLHRHAGRLRQQGLHRRRPGPGAHDRHRRTSGASTRPRPGRHLQGPGGQRRRTRTARRRSARSRTRTRRGRGTTAATRNASGRQRDFKFGRTMSTACIVDDVVYIAELHGYLHCLDAKTGKHYWQYDTKAAIWGSPYYVDGKVFLGNEDGDLFVFKHEKKHDDDRRARGREGRRGHEGRARRDARRRCAKKVADEVPAREDRVRRHRSAARRSSPTACCT